MTGHDEAFTSLHVLAAIVAIGPVTVATTKAVALLPGMGGLLAVHRLRAAAPDNR
ncbi:hypothetical protein GCM10027570_38020 [Streptomonospora sediminis]